MPSPKVAAAWAFSWRCARNAPVRTYAKRSLTRLVFPGRDARAPFRRVVLRGAPFETELELSES